MPAQQRSDNPTHPSATPTRTEFARALRELRLWSGLTLEEVRDLQPRLRVATSSDYERALRLPGWEWVHGFVTTCLNHPKPPHRPLSPHRLRGELEHWQTAWGHAKKHPTPEPQPEPEPEPPTRDHVEPADPEPPDAVPAADTAQPAPTISPAPATGAPVPVAGPVIDAPHPCGDSDSSYVGSTDLDHLDAARPAGGNSPRRRGWILAAAAVAVVLAAGTAATATGMFERPSQTPPPATAGPSSATYSAPPPPALAAVRVVGNADDLPTSQGIDLDNGKTLDQLAPGVDTSFSSKSTHLDSMSTRAFFAVLPTPVPQERTYCEQVTGWTRETYPNVYSLTEGRNICVKTDEGRLAMLTVTRRATPATVNIQP